MDRQTTDGLCKAGARAIEARNYQSAERAFRQGLDIATSNYERGVLLYNCSICAAHLDRPDEAFELLASATAHDPSLASKVDVLDFPAFLHLQVRDRKDAILQVMGAAEKARRSAERKLGLRFLGSGVLVAIVGACAIACGAYSFGMLAAIAGYVLFDIGLGKTIGFSLLGFFF